ncbi:Aste57867_8914 [Aphanomyces stellatus]|uniref:Aste57867_8914 protein n=1 Tax=Aphanomyces stellatus TaxID=120398 RepID=A0A485KLP4_9STRA|nr:hypothetical protein As57867_008879 [Aphanomyces stellatus]VFT85798.1 Aste57867_8914 [Aphanomyces stellatus]
MDHVDLSTGISWHPVDPKKRRDERPLLANAAFQCAYDKTHSAVNSVLQKANQACFEQVLDFFVHRTSSSTYPHLLPLRPFPVAAVIAGTDAGAASSALWTDPLIRRLKHRFPFVVSLQRKFTTGRQMIEYIAGAVFADIQRRELEGQWLHLEMQRKEKRLTSRRAYHLKEPRESDLPSIKWDTVATILTLLAKVVGPVMHQSDDVTIQAEMLYMELYADAEQSLCEYDSYAATCQCLDRMLMDSADRIKSVRTLVGEDTTAERQMTRLHQWLLGRYRDVVEHQLKMETVDAARHALRQKIRAIMADLSPVAAATPSSSSSTPCVVLVLDQYEGVSESVFADLLHMWRDHSAALGVGVVLGISSTFSPSYRRMPLRIASAIYMEPFVLEDSFKSFKDIVQTLVIAGEFPVMLSGRVYKWLHATFTRTHSIQSFLVALKWILYEHVTTTPRHVLALLPLKELADLGLPHTVEAYVASIRGKASDKGSADDGLIDAVVHVHLWKQTWQCMWSCVDMTWQMCTKFDPTWASLNVEMVSLALDGRLAGSVVAHRMHMFLHQASLRVLHSLVLEWRDCIARYDMDGLVPQTHLSPVADAIEEMVQVLGFVSEAGDDDADVAKMIPSIREDLCKVVDRRLLPCLSPALPLACAAAGCFFYFDNVETLEKHLESHHEAGVRQSLETRQPRGARNAWSQDMHVLHDFYRHTAGMLINVAEWLDDFRAKIETKDHVHARFLRGLSALQYLGFIRRYGRSDDYVEKLVFL